MNKLVDPIRELKLLPEQLFGHQISGKQEIKWSFSCIVVTFMACIFLFKTSLQAQDAKSILEQVHEKQQQRWNGVDNYTVTMALQDAMGMETSVYHVRTELEGQVTFRQVPRVLYEREMVINAGMPPPEEVASEMAKGYRLFGASGAPTYGLDYNQMADFLDAGAESFMTTSDGTSEAKDDIQDMKEFIKRAKLVGTQMVRSTYSEGGTPDMVEAYHLAATNLEDIPMDQNEGGGKFTLERASLFIDKQELVPLALTMHGNVEKGNEKMPITISKFDSDYQQVGSLYEPHVTVYQIKGITQAMSKKEQKEMEKAKAQFENMTDEQKEMMERMMPGKMEQLMKMMEGESYRSIVKVVSIAINEGPPSAYGLGSLGGSGALTIAGEGENSEGMLVAELSISTGPNHSQELQVTLKGDRLYPLEEGGNVTVIDASGTVMRNGKSLGVEGGSGQISVIERTETRIKGTYSALLKLPENGTLQISGNFDSGAPIGPGQAPRGSPIPAGLFSDTN